MSIQSLLYFCCMSVRVRETEAAEKIMLEECSLTIQCHSEFKPRPTPPPNLGKLYQISLLTGPFRKHCNMATIEKEPAWMNNGNTVSVGHRLKSKSWHCSAKTQIVSNNRDHCGFFSYWRRTYRRFQASRSAVSIFWFVQTTSFQLDIHIASPEIHFFHLTLEMLSVSIP